VNWRNPTSRIAEMTTTGDRSGSGAVALTSVVVAIGSSTFSVDGVARGGGSGIVAWSVAVWPSSISTVWSRIDFPPAVTTT
jgi:hypothetical protein